MTEADTLYCRLGSQASGPSELFDPEQTAVLPEIAQRYFSHAIAPGTALFSVAELEMEGTFLLGEKERFQTYVMTARQVLRPPDQFVWMPRLRWGPLIITGSDGLASGDAWTRFWLFGAVPVAQECSSPDLVRSAQFRAAVEGALWLPTSLLPARGVHWEQIGVNDAKVTFCRVHPVVSLHMKLDAAGAVREVTGQRWSNANRHKQFQVQPFGGTIAAERTFQGLTIPTETSVGNHYGTEEYLPFFQAKIVHARFR